MFLLRLRKDRIFFCDRDLLIESFDIITIYCRLLGHASNGDEPVLLVERKIHFIELDLKIHDVVQSLIIRLENLFTFFRLDLLKSP